MNINEMQRGFSLGVRLKTDLHILLRPDRLMVLILPLIQSKLI